MQKLYMYKTSALQWWDFGTSLCGKKQNGGQKL